MGLIIQQKALQAAGGLRQVLPVVRKRDRSLFDQIHRAMNSVVLNIAEADGNDPGDGENSICQCVRLGQRGASWASAHRGLRLRLALTSQRRGHRAR